MRLSKASNLPRGGSIVNIFSNGGGTHGYPYRSPYATSKAALNGFTATLAMELGLDKIRVNTVCPGLISGDRCDRVIALTAHASGATEADVRAKWKSQNIMRSFIEAEDIAAAVGFLLSDDARFITSQTINVDAGTTTLDNLDDYEPLVSKNPSE